MQIGLTVLRKRAGAAVLAALAALYALIWLLVPDAPFAQPSAALSRDAETTTAGQGLRSSTDPPAAAPDDALREPFVNDVEFGRPRDAIDAAALGGLHADKKGARSGRGRPEQTAPERRAALPPADPPPPERVSASRGAFLRTEFGEISIFPSDNPWNQDVSKLPISAKSREYIDSIGADKPLHPDFGAEWHGAPNGIPFVVVRGDQPKVPVQFEYAEESDPGPYPIPPDAPIEGGPQATGDRHLLVIDFDNKKLYELFSAYPRAAGWMAGSGAIFDLTSNALRPAGWTSADAAGLPVFAGLVRYDEVIERGQILHALRFTARRTQRAFIPPATHFASRSNDPRLPPMGLRLRLRASFDETGFPRPAQVILRALKQYGMILADNGSDWFISGAPHPRWNDEELSALKKVRGRDFEVVDTGEPISR
jgi:hypothetical protein